MQYNQNKHILRSNLEKAMVYIKKAKEVARNGDCLENLKDLKDIERAILDIIEKGKNNGNNGKIE